MHVGSLASHASNLSPKPEREQITRVQALTTQSNLARMAPQLVIFIEKQAGECMTPSLSEERKWSQKEPASCACTCDESQNILLRTWWTLCYLIEVSRTLAQPKKACSLLCVHLWSKAKAFHRGHELWDQTTLWNLSTIKTRFACQLPTMGNTCLHWSLSSKDYSHPWNTIPRWFPPRQGWCLGENHPTLCLVRVRVIITPRCG